MNVALPAEVNYISLFAGVGGMDLSLSIALPGARCVCYVEVGMEAVEILAARMEEGSLDAAPVYSDVTHFNGERWRGKVDLVIAGFPCPPVSVAGKREGTGDDRWLWPEVIRIVREAGAGWVFLENVRGLLSANVGRAFADILRDLALAGFDAEWLTLPASAVGAPHKRERVFILAVDDATSPRLSRRESGQGAAPRDEARLRESSGRCDGLFPPGPGLGGSGTLDNIRKLYAKSPEAAWRSYQAELANTLRWRDLLDAAPWLAPSISAEEAEQSFRLLADGLAAILARRRTDALRAAGNGVVALQGAVAFVELVRRITG